VVVVEEQLMVEEEEWPVLEVALQYRLTPHKLSRISKRSAP